MDRECPRCGTVNPPRTRRCECGYRFRVRSDEDDDFDDDAPQEVRSVESLAKIARLQKTLIWIILIELLFGIGGAVTAAILSRFVNPLISLAAICVVLFALQVVSLIVLFKMSAELKNYTAIVLVAIGLVVPFVGLIGLLMANASATGALQRAGVRIGLMGAYPRDLRRLSSPNRRSAARSSGSRDDDLPTTERVG